MMDLAKDLELPGLPTKNNGILNSIHTTIINTFSLSAALLAILGPNFICLKNMVWHLQVACKMSMYQCNTYWTISCENLSLPPGIANGGRKC